MEEQEIGRGLLSKILKDIEISKEDFINILLNEASNSLNGSVTEIAMQLRSIFKRVVPDFSIDSNGMPHIKPSTKSLDFEEMVSDFFTLIFNYHSIMISE